MKKFFPFVLALPPLLAGAASVAWSLRPAPPVPSSQFSGFSEFSGLPTQRLAHSNGLALTIARTLRARKQPDGWSIDANPGARYATQVQVSRAGELLSVGALPESRRLGTREIRFRSEVAQAGGASGDELMLEIWALEETSRGRVLYLFSGPGSGSDDLLWHVARGTTLGAR